MTEGGENKKRKKLSGISANGLWMGDASNATPDLSKKGNVPQEGARRGEKTRVATGTEDTHV